MARQHEHRREPKREGLASLRSVADITCLSCNKIKPGTGAEPFRTWGHVCAPCAKRLRTVDAQSTQRATP